jgi:DNA-binding NarL/FixJ family response regulator
VVRAGYQLSTPERDWLKSLVDASNRLLDRGDGVMAYAYECSGSAVRFGEFASIGRAEASFERLAECVARQEAVVQLRLYRDAIPFGSISERLDLGARLAAAPFFVERFHQLGVRDFLALNATDPTASGVVVCAPLRTIYTSSPGARARWARAAAHIAAAFRLRRALGPANPLSDAAAILTPAGRIEHIEPAASSKRARAALKRAAKIVERVTSSARADPDVLQAWTALVDGKWSMIDCFDRDGKRFVVARRNDPALPSGLALTPDEAQVLGFARLGHSLKLIAYELGHPLSTTAVLLERGLKKLGFRSRQELTAMLGDHA